MDRLKPALQYYPWGSRTLLADLRGAPSPSQRPEAELWYGAHPASPSTVGDQSLDQLIASAPEQMLGEKIAAQYADKLPFLVKLLAANEPLSLQAHPSADKAKEGFARENAAGIPVDASNRNYRDESHKPELLIALSDFEALAGFRPLAQTRELLDGLDCHALNHYTSMLGSDSQQEETDLRVLFTTWISLPSTARQELVREVISTAQRRVEEQALPEWMLEALRALIALDERYPGDMGVLAALLLHHVRLAPGEALHLEAGQLHAYLSGLAVEVMANSDNVLRGGLTSKHVDVPELVRVLHFASLEDPRVAVNKGVFDVDVEEFKVFQADLSTALIHESEGPSIALVTAGEVHANDEVLRPGEAVWIPANEEAVRFSAPAGRENESQVFIITV